MEAGFIFIFFGEELIFFYHQVYRCVRLHKLKPGISHSTIADFVVCYSAGVNETNVAPLCGILSRVDEKQYAHSGFIELLLMRTLGAYVIDFASY